MVLMSKRQCNLKLYNVNNLHLKEDSVQKHQESVVFFAMVDTSIINVCWFLFQQGNLHKINIFCYNFFQDRIAADGPCRKKFSIHIVSDVNGTSPDSQSSENQTETALNGDNLLPTPDLPPVSTYNLAFNSPISLYFILDAWNTIPSYMFDFCY